MEFRRARSTEQALTWLSETGDSARVIAGGTDVMMQHARGELDAEVFVHIEGLSGLAGAKLGSIAGERDASRFGALITHRQLATDPQVRSRHPGLSEAAATVGGWQTQAVGTLGGNVCNASPAADTAAPLLAAEAFVELRSLAGTRRVALADFFLGRRAVDRRPDELVTAIDARPLGENEAEVYLKVGRRGAMVVAVVGIAVRLLFDAQGHQVRQARVALCSVAPMPVRAPATENALVAGNTTGDAVRQAGLELLAEVTPIDDARGSAAYRRMILPGLLERAVSICCSRAQAQKA